MSPISIDMARFQVVKMTGDITATDEGEVGGTSGILATKREMVYTFFLFGAGRDAGPPKTLRRHYLSTYISLSLLIPFLCVVGAFSPCFVFFAALFLHMFRGDAGSEEMISFEWGNPSETGEAAGMEVVVFFFFFSLSLHMSLCLAPCFSSFLFMIVSFFLSPIYISYD